MRVGLAVARRLGPELLNSSGLWSSAIWVWRPTHRPWQKKRACGLHCSCPVLRVLF